MLLRYPASYPAIGDMATSVSLHKLFGCWKPQKASGRRVMRPWAVFSQSEACYTASCRLLYTLRATKTAPCHIRTVKRCVIRRYAVLGALLGCSMDTGGK